MPGRGVIGIAAALVLAGVAGGVLSRSLMHSGASDQSMTTARVLALFNDQRAARGLRPLTFDAKLAQAATSHSADMLRRGYFAHNGPQGKWDVRIRRYVKRAMVGEILSFGAGRHATPRGMVAAWMQSPAHRRVILTPELGRVGLGVAIGTYRGQRDTAMATADFSSTR
jgi:uncharacterized protein YkwD